MVSVLTGTSNSPLHVRRMPSTDTSNLAETLVCFARKFLRAPPARNALEAVPLGDRNAINHFVLLENGIDWHLLLKKTLTERNLVCNAATVDLDLHQVCLFLLQRGLANLSMAEDADDSAVLLNTFKLTGDGGAGAFGVLLGVLGKGLLLRLVPVLIESALEFVAEVLGPDGSKGA